MSKPMTLAEFGERFWTDANGKTYAIANRSRNVMQVVERHLDHAGNVSAVTYTHNDGKSRTVLAASFLKDFKPIPKPLPRAVFAPVPANEPVRPQPLARDVATMVLHDLRLSGILDTEALAKAMLFQGLGKQITDALVAELTDKLAVRLGKVLFTRNFIVTLVTEIQRQTATPQLPLEHTLPEGQYEHPEVGENGRGD